MCVFRPQQDNYRHPSILAMESRLAKYHDDEAFMGGFATTLSNGEYLKSLVLQPSVLAFMGCVGASIADTAIASVDLDFVLSTIQPHLFAIFDVK